MVSVIREKADGTAGLTYENGGSCLQSVYNPGLEGSMNIRNYEGVNNEYPGVKKAQLNNYSVPLPSPPLPPLPSIPLPSLPLISSSNTYIMTSYYRYDVRIVTSLLRGS